MIDSNTNVLDHLIKLRNFINVSKVKNDFKHN